MSFARKVGDVLDEPKGAIVIADGKVLMAGAIVIRKSRLRRAKRFGWREVPSPDGRPIAPGCVMVERAKEST